MRIDRYHLLDGRIQRDQGGLLREAVKLLVQLEERLDVCAKRAIRCTCILQKARQRLGIVDCDCG